MISNSGVSSILKSSVHGTDSTVTGGPSMLSNHGDLRRTHNPSLKESFESSNSVEIIQSGPNKCVVCGKGFVLKKKHFCKFCQNPVCSDHSSKTRKKLGESDLQRICDNCEQSEAKKDIKNEIQDEVCRMNEELISVKETNDRLNREYFEKTSILNEIEQRIHVSESAHTRKLQELQEEFESQQRQAEKTKVLLANLKKQLENTRDSEEDMTEKCQRAENEIEMLTKKSVEVKKAKEAMSVETDLITTKLKNTINLETISKSLCQRCSNRLNESFNKIKNTAYWLQEVTEEEEKTVKEEDCLKP